MLQPRPGLISEPLDTPMDILNPMFLPVWKETSAREDHHSDMVCHSDSKIETTLQWRFTAEIWKRMRYVFEDQEMEMNVVTFDDMITLETIQK